MLTYLCKIAGVSRSGYYHYFSIKSQEQRKLQDEKNEILKENILKAYRFKRYKKGHVKTRLHWRVILRLSTI